MSKKIAAALERLEAHYANEPVPGGVTVGPEALEAIIASLDAYERAQDTGTDGEEIQAGLEFAETIRTQLGISTVDRPHTD